MWSDKVQSNLSIMNIFGQKAVAIVESWSLCRGFTCKHVFIINALIQAILCLLESMRPLALGEGLWHDSSLWCSQRLEYCFISALASFGTWTGYAKWRPCKEVEIKCFAGKNDNTAVAQWVGSSVIPFINLQLPEMI